MTFRNVQSELTAGHGVDDLGDGVVVGATEAGEVLGDG